MHFHTSRYFVRLRAPREKYLQSASHAFVVRRTICRMYICAGELLRVRGNFFTCPWWSWWPQRMFPLMFSSALDSQRVELQKNAALCHRCLCTANRRLVPSPLNAVDQRAQSSPCRDRVTMPPTTCQNLEKHMDTEQDLCAAGNFCASSRSCAAPAHQPRHKTTVISCSCRVCC